MAIPTSKRLAYLDWMRGLAALIMLQGHVFHSFLKPEHRESSIYVLSQFVGGMPAVIFLFLTGVTLAFLMDGRERKGVPPVERIVVGLRRAGYLFAVAILFRLQMWLFGLPFSPWTDLFRVDILNCMALAIAVFSFLAAFHTVDRIRLGAIAGFGIAFASPLVSLIDWTAVPQGLHDYLAPSHTSFGFFPNAAYAAFGVAAGSVIRSVSSEHLDRIFQWAALAGTVLILAGYYFSGSPYSLYPSSDYWLNSPTLVLIKLGVILWLGAFSFLWNKGVSSERWGFIRQFGMTSLLVYWVHIELVYGRPLYFFKESLEIGQTVAAALAMIVFMQLLSLARTNYHRWSGWLPNLRLPWYEPVPRRASGD